MEAIIRRALDVIILGLFAWVIFHLVDTRSRVAAANEVITTEETNRVAAYKQCEIKPQGNDRRLCEFIHSFATEKAAIAEREKAAARTDEDRAGKLLTLSIMISLIYILLRWILTRKPRPRAAGPWP